MINITRHPSYIGHLLFAVLYIVSYIPYIIICYTRFIYRGISSHAYFSITNKLPGVNTVTKKLQIMDVCMEYKPKSFTPFRGVLGLPFIAAFADKNPKRTDKPIFTISTCSCCHYCGIMKDK